MHRLVFLLVNLLSERFSARHDAQLRFLRAENRILRSRIPQARIIPTPDERAELMKIGSELDHEVNGLISIVQYRTYRRWLRERAAGRAVGRAGRPRKVSDEVRKLIKRLALENGQWGLRRIAGELLKLRVRVSKSTVARVLEEMDLEPPGDDRRSGDRRTTSWQSFMKLHTNTIVACDFFTKEVRTLTCRKTAYCLAFMHLGTRKVWCSHPTYHPDDAWVRQQARNVLMWLEDNRLSVTHLIRDRDAKFSLGFDMIFNSVVKRVIRTPVQAPNANAFMEAWIGSLKRECLNHFVCFSLSHVGHIVDRYVEFYNEHRPHQSMRNRTLSFVPRGEDREDEALSDLSTQPIGCIRCHKELGGLLKHYERSAA